MTTARTASRKGKVLNLRLEPAERKELSHWAERNGFKALGTCIRVKCLELARACDLPQDQPPRAA